MREHVSVRGLRNLRFSLWLFRYFLKTYVYTPSTPCRDVKSCPKIPLGGLSWNSLTEVMWHYQINGFSNSKVWKSWQENIHVGLENDWSSSFVLLYGWNNEDVRWGFSLFKSIGKLEQSKFSRLVAKLKIAHNFPMDLNRENPPQYIFLISSIE